MGRLRRPVMLMILAALGFQVLVVPWDVWVTPASDSEREGLAAKVTEAMKIFGKGDDLTQGFREYLDALRYGPPDRIGVTWLSKTPVVVYALFWAPPSPRVWPAITSLPERKMLLLDQVREGLWRFGPDTLHRRINEERLVLQMLVTIIVGLIGLLILPRATRGRPDDA